MASNNAKGASLTVAEAEAALALACKRAQAASEAVTAAKSAVRIAKARAAADAAVAAARATRNARETAKRLAARIGVELEQHTDLDSRPWFVSHPALEGAADPYEGDHYASDWDDVLRRVRGYESALSKRT